MAPYTSIQAVADYYFPFIPVSLLLNQKMDALNDIKRVEAPILIIHGTNDWTISYHLGKQMFEAAQSSKDIITLSGEGHGFALNKRRLSTLAHSFFTQSVLKMEQSVNIQ